MEPIPDTGGGLSGFVAYLLWDVYRYFPFEGTWDWLVLGILMAFAIRVVHLPFLWRLIAFDMRMLAQKDNSGSTLWRRAALRSWWLLGSPILCLMFCSWLLSTPAGQTFWQGREFGEDGSVIKYVSSLFVSLWVIPPLYSAITWISFGGKWLDTMPGKQEPQAFSDRRLRSLFCGGGVLGIGQGFGRQTVPEGIVVELRGPMHNRGLMVIEAICCFPVFLAVTALADTPGSPFIPALPAFYLLTYLVNEPIRMLFVYILHKRTFG